jgi:integrase
MGMQNERRTSKNRGWHEGSIFQRSDGRWVAMLSLEDGQRKSLYGKTRQDVVRKLAAAQRDREQGLPFVSDRQTVEQYLTGWLLTQQTRLRPRSYVRYRDDVSLHILPTLGWMKLSRLTAQHIERLYAEKRAAGLSVGSLQHLHAVLHKALADAVRLEVVARNVATLARAPRAPRPEMKYFTEEQAQMFLRGIHGDPLEAFYVLALNTGMRRGELLALHWQDIHFDSAFPFAEVKYTLQDERGGRFTFAPPKTLRGLRYVPLNHTAVRALREHAVRQLAQRQALEASEAGAAWHDEDLVFTTAFGGPMRGNHILQRHFEPLCRRLGLPRIRLHDLRHTAATLMLAGHQPTEFVSKVLGHSTPSITSDIYMHVTTAMTQAAVAALDPLFADISHTSSTTRTSGMPSLPGTLKSFDADATDSTNAADAPDTSATAAVFPRP